MICTKVHTNVLLYCSEVRHNIYNVNIKVNKLEISIFTVETPQDSLYTRSTQSTELLMLVYTSHIHVHPSVNIHHGQVLHMHPTSMLA
jgi:hypothetical protein